MARMEMVVAIWDVPRKDLLPVSLLCLLDFVLWLSEDYKTTPGSIREKLSALFPMSAI